MTSFTERVRYGQEKHERRKVFQLLGNPPAHHREPIDLVCFDRRGRATLIRARGNGHGHINSMTMMRLRQVGIQCGARVLWAHANGENEIVYEIVYENGRK